VYLRENPNPKHSARDEVLKYPSPKGKETVLPLRLLPDYLEFHNVRPARYRAGYNILLVEQREAEKE
jgi:hypothetical protein